MVNVTLQDVAGHAGVSMKTVSRVVNRDAKVRESTRSKVQESIQALGYRPNRFARSLAGNKSYLLGLLYDNPSAAYVLAMQEGVLERCEKEGYGLLIHPCDFKSNDLVDDILNLVQQSRVDGLILTPPLSDSRVLVEALETNDIQFVRVSPAAHHNSGYVVSNESSAVEQLITNLVSLGHRRIGFIAGGSEHGASQWRLQGFQQAMKIAGLDVESSLIAQGDFSFESGERCARTLLDQEDRPSAIFASNDYMAAGVMKVAMQMGLSIPKDLSIAGFDDAPVASQLWPPLTTIKQPVKAIASQVTGILIYQILERSEYEPSETLECELVIRGTTGINLA